MAIPASSSASIGRHKSSHLKRCRAPHQPRTSPASPFGPCSCRRLRTPARLLAHSFPGKEHWPSRHGVAKRADSSKHVPKLQSIFCYPRCFWGPDLCYASSSTMTALVRWRFSFSDFLVDAAPVSPACLHTECHCHEAVPRSWSALQHTHARTLSLFRGCT